MHHALINRQFDERLAITICQVALPPVGLDDLPIGRTGDVRILLDAQARRYVPDAELTPLHRAFLDVVASMTPPGYGIGATFTRVMPAAATEANEAHRDRDNEALNFVCFVAAGPSVHHEFIADTDPFETWPIVVPNGHVVRFGKALHRRPTRPAGTGRKVFLTASVWPIGAASVPDVPQAAEPYECLGGPVQ